MKAFKTSAKISEKNRISRYKNTIATIYITKELRKNTNSAIINELFLDTTLVIHLIFHKTSEKEI